MATRLEELPWIDTYYAVRLALIDRPDVRVCIERIEERGEPALRVLAFDDARTWGAHGIVYAEAALFGGRAHLVAFARAVARYVAKFDIAPDAGTMAAHASLDGGGHDGSERAERGGDGGGRGSRHDAGHGGRAARGGRDAG